MKKNGDSIMVILSSPSGAGKTTISKKLQQKYQNFKISVSHTTRTPRPNEVDGIDYFFVSHDEFKKLIEKNEFYEYAEIFGNYYGTSHSSVKSEMDAGKNIILDPCQVSCLNYYSRLFYL